MSSGAPPTWHTRLAASTPLAVEEQRVRKAHYSKRTAENLVAFGLIDSATADSSHQKRRRTGTSPTAPKESHLRQVSGGPRHTLNLHRIPVASLPKAVAFGKQTRLPASSPPSAPATGSKLKELHNEEMFAFRGTARRERSFKGSSCAACEEPLEHMLRGERILQLSCGHVSHEACFYEYIKEFEAQTCPECNQPLGFDTSRGGNIDFENLNKLVRSIQTSDPGERPRDVRKTPVPWEPGVEATTRESGDRQPSVPARAPRDHLLPDSTYVAGHPPRAVAQSQSQSQSQSHSRQVSRETAGVSSNDFSEPQQMNGRRHAYDVHSTEASVVSPRNSIKNPIPLPTVSVRSEFPTLNKSRHSQSLTCLVTVEVAEGKWHPHPEDIGHESKIPPIAEKVSERPMAQLAPPQPRPPVDSVHEDMALEEARDDLFARVDNWHGLDFERFGRLVLQGTVRVGKDRQAWQELECYLFSEMLICVKEKKSGLNRSQQWENAEGPTQPTRLTLKGSILIKRHLRHVESSYEDEILTLNLTVSELPAFHLQFHKREQLEAWRTALINIDSPGPATPQQSEFDYGSDEETDIRREESIMSPAPSSPRAGPPSNATAPTEYTSRQSKRGTSLVTLPVHVPLDIVVVVPISSSMHGLKMNLLHDALRFLIASLGEQDRISVVTFGSAIGGMPVVGLTTKDWHGWDAALDLIQPMPHKSSRADVVEGANVAVDLLMQRKSSNPLSHIILISDSPSSDPESVDFVVSRAEAAKIGIHSFGLGMAHKPDTMVEMSTRTKGSYTYVRDWMMLQECLAGCIGAMQSISHQNAKLRLRLPEGSPAKFLKISGALQVTKRSTGRDAEASLGDLHFGDKRDILVQLSVQPDSSSPDSVPSDPWESIVSGLEALSPLDRDEQRTLSIQEVPLLQADVTWGDILRDGTTLQLPRPSLLAIPILRAPPKRSTTGHLSTPPIPPHPLIVQRRMELLTSDMLSRALGLVARNQNDRAHHLLAETRSILKGLGKGGRISPPPPPTPPPTTALPPTPRAGESKTSPLESAFPQPPSLKSSSPRPHAEAPHSLAPAAGVDQTTLTALDSELEASLEWISHPAIFARDSRKTVLQAIGVISSQRGYTFRTPAESLWAARVPGVRLLSERHREWNENGTG